MTNLKNLLKVGMVVSCARENGAREGILWKILKIKGDLVRIEPVLTLTGQSVHNPRWIHYVEVQPIELIDLCQVRLKLDLIINEIARFRSGEGKT